MYRRVTGKLSHVTIRNDFLIGVLIVSRFVIGGIHLWQVELFNLCLNLCLNFFLDLCLDIFLDMWAGTVGVVVKS